MNDGFKTDFVLLKFVLYLLISYLF